MKTLILESADGSVQAEIKVDIFGTNAVLAVPGADTRFTNMEIIEGDAAIVAGIDLQETEGNFQAIVALAKLLNLNLTVIDLNEASPLNLLVRPIISAGADQTGVVNGTGAVLLAGVVTDPGSAAITDILWSLESKTGVGTPVFDDTTILTPSITGIDTSAGDYIFKITATNGDTLVATDTVIVTVLPV